MQKIKFICSKCQKKLSAEKSAAGMKTWCPECNMSLVIPSTPAKTKAPDALKSKDSKINRPHPKEDKIMEITEKESGNGSTRSTSSSGSLANDNQQSMLLEKERIFELEELLEQRRVEFADWVKESERQLVSQQTVYAKKIAAIEKNFDEERKAAQALRVHLKEKDEEFNTLLSKLNQIRTTADKIQNELVNKLKNTEIQLNEVNEKLEQKDLEQEKLTLKHSEMLEKIRELLNECGKDDEMTKNSRLVSTV